MAMPIKTVQMKQEQIKRHELSADANSSLEWQKMLLPSNACKMMRDNFTAQPLKAQVCFFQHDFEAFTNSFCISLISLLSL